MLDRRIRETRSKEETKKARIQAVITVVVMFIAFLVIGKIQQVIFKALTKDDTSRFISAGLISFTVAVVLIILIVYAIYRYGKSRERHRKK